MDPDAMVSEQTESGKRLIKALAAAGFDVKIAFWAIPTEADKWYLYLASPYRDERGPFMAYRFVHDILEQTPDLWIDRFEVKVLGMNDSLTQAALAAAESAANRMSGVRNTKPNPRMIRVGKSVFGGLPIDAAYIYPPLQPAA
jgi:hypothetical protein